MTAALLSFSEALQSMCLTCRGALCSRVSPNWIKYWPANAPTQAKQACWGSASGPQASDK